MRTISPVWAFTAMLAVGEGAESQKPATTSAFDRYVMLTEQRVDTEVRSPDRFLYVDTLAKPKRDAAVRALRSGSVVIEPLQTKDSGRKITAPNGMIHHWVGTVFVPGTNVDGAVALLQDYDRHSEVYSPNVVRAKTLSKNGYTYRVHLRFYMKKVIGVTMNTEHEAVFSHAQPDRAWSRIHSTRVAEVADAGTPDERELRPGEERGFMWRLNSYWRFLGRDGGTYIQCESVTLSTDIPWAFRLFIGPFVTAVPRDTLTFTLERTRSALTAPTRAGGR